MMKTAATFAILALLLCSATAQAVVTFDWATVGNPGNAGDVQAHGTFGGVDYVYRISKYEVTNIQYSEFLNSVDPTGANSLALYTPLMSSQPSGGINVSGGAANGSKYQLKPGHKHNPVAFVSFFDAMRFTNWLQNGQGSGSTEAGVYAIGNGVNETRNPSARYFIPSENEWYKAAYHKNDGATGNYWKFPTSSDAVPFSDQPPGNDAPATTNTANYFNDDATADGYNDGFAATGSTDFSETQNYLTDVGAYTTAQSPYGTFDQGGNVWEWNESVIEVVGELSPFRGLRGGFWGDSYSDNLSSSPAFNYADPAFEAHFHGFRVASKVPEPATSNLVAVLAAIGVASRRHAQMRR